jgi:hypothetical protein
MPRFVSRSAGLYGPRLLILVLGFGFVAQAFMACGPWSWFVVGISLGFVLWFSVRRWQLRPLWPGVLDFFFSGFVLIRTNHTPSVPQNLRAAGHKGLRYTSRPSTVIVFEKYSSCEIQGILDQAGTAPAGATAMIP